MLESTFGFWWSCSRSEFIAMFQRELFIIGRRTLFGWFLWAKVSSLRGHPSAPRLAFEVVNTYVKASVGCTLLCSSSEERVIDISVGVDLESLSCRGDILLGKEGEQRRRDASGGQGGVRPIAVDVGAQRDCAAGGEPAAGQRAASGWGGDPPADLYAGAFLRSRPCSPPAQVLLRPRGQRFPHHRYPYLGGLTFLMYRLPLVECLMFGALISATDPVTVLSIFQVS
ncbi:hypothetical protein BHE74_00021385 [Ensete ventricosum]|nr:hypothetical protein BHE74_00021385 [Ensete ventricosum]